MLWIKSAFASNMIYWKIISNTIKKEQTTTQHIYYKTYDCVCYVYVLSRQWNGTKIYNTWFFSCLSLKSLSESFFSFFKTWKFDFWITNHESLIRTLITRGWLNCCRQILLKICLRRRWQKKQMLCLYFFVWAIWLPKGKMTRGKPHLSDLHKFIYTRFTKRL